MLFDLEDLEMWEPVLFGATSKKQLIDAVAKRKEGQEVEETIFKQVVSLVTLSEQCFPQNQTVFVVVGDGDGAIHEIVPMLVNLLLLPDTAPC